MNAGTSRAITAMWLFALGACGAGCVGEATGSGPGAADGAPTTDGPASGDGASDGGAGPVLLVPIEVLGNGSPDAPVVASAALPLTAGDIASVRSLYVQCHRCGFYGPPEFEALAKPLTTVKASLRIVGDSGGAASNAPWIDITNATVRVDDEARAHGGMNGALVSLGFRVPIDDATRAQLRPAPSLNRIEVRFNGTDGGSNGFRVLDMQFQDGDGHELSHVPRVWADVSAEKIAGQNPSSASARGQALWTGRNLLIKSPIVPRPIRAACNDCHAADGRDLQYFNYSNNAIVQRSRFHGLTEDQGKDIAAYLRASLFARVPHVPAAAPWNPPYQPGPGLDGKPTAEWAAGAGLGAVLPNGKAFVKAFVGQPIDDTALSVTQAELDAAMDLTRVLDTREMPIPLQFPDWNAWLPIVHPLDIWTPDAGRSAGLFETGSQGKPLAAYASIVDWLEKHENPNGTYGDWSHLLANQRDQLQGLLQDLGGQTLAFGGGGRGKRSFHGSVDASGKWIGQGEPRGWPYGWPTIFYLAPHMLYAPTSTPQGTREFYFSWENRLVSYYQTDAWYALQVTINPGWAGASNGGVDWPYTQGFITGLADDLMTAGAPASIAAAHLARYFQINAKLGQLANTKIPFNQPDLADPTNIWRNRGLQSKADLLFKLSPAVVMDSSYDQRTRFRLLDELGPGTYLKFVNAALSAYAALYFDTSPSQYRICDPSNTQMGTPEQFAGQRFCIDASRTDLPTDSKGHPYCPYPSNVGYTTEQFSVWGVIIGTQLGADPDRLRRWSAWNDRMWPR